MDPPPLASHASVWFCPALSTLPLLTTITVRGVIFVVGAVILVVLNVFVVGVDVSVVIVSVVGGCVVWCGVAAVDVIGIVDGVVDVVVGVVVVGGGVVVGGVVVGGGVVTIVAFIVVGLVEGLVVTESSTDSE